MNPKNTIPPRLAQRLLQSFLRDDLVEEVLGDLEEKFYSLADKSPFKAKLNYWYQVFKYIRPFAIRRRSLYVNHNYNAMYRSYFSTAYRNLVKNKLHSFINIAGLSVGMAVSLVIGLWIWDELSYNRSIPNCDKIAQVIQNVTNNGEVQTWRTVPYPLAEELRKNYGSDFEYVVLTTGLFEHFVAHQDKKLTQSGLYAEAEIVNILSLRMLQGNADALRDPSAILISSTSARAIFGDEDPINKPLVIDEQFTGQVMGVFEDLPLNSRFKEVSFIASWQGMVNNTNWIRNMDDPWRPNAFNIFVQLIDQSDFAAASLKIRDAKLKKVNEALAKKRPELFLDPMSRWHLYAEFENGKNIGGRIQYVWLFGIVGVFVLLMACINFMNLSTARSEKRAKEVGIRKAVGSLRGQLITQFLCESILIVFIAFLFSLLLVRGALPLFNEVAEKQMSLPWANPLGWTMGISFCIVTGLIAGSYPAFYLSSVKSGIALKGLLKAGRAASLPRKVLVVLQFTVSIVMIVGTSVVFIQIQFAKNRPLGYDSNGLVAVFTINNNIHKLFDAVRNELQQSGAVVSMAESASPTTQSWSSSSGFDWNGKDPDLSIDFPNFSVSHDYGKTIGWEISEGRDFSREFLSDSSAVIINESAARFMNLKDPVGETIGWFGTPYHVIGVVRDMITTSPYEPVNPALYYLSTEANNCVIMKINPEANTAKALASIEGVFKKFNPDQPFEYQFMDEEYAKKFGHEERIGKLAAYFAALAIFISSLGIFGLASFVAEQRTKELGIRKVLGASVINLWQMLTKDFVVLVSIACLMAIPIGYLLMNSWLQNFRYHTGIPWWISVITIVGTLSITLLTVSYQAVKVALMNPVKSLKTE